MTPLTAEEIQAVAGGVTAGPDGTGCTNPHIIIMDPDIIQTDTVQQK